MLSKNDCASRKPAIFTFFKLTISLLVSVQYHYQCGSIQSNIIISVSAISLLVLVDSVQYHYQCQQIQYNIIISVSAISLLVLVDSVQYHYQCKWIQYNIIISVSTISLLVLVDSVQYHYQCQWIQYNIIISVIQSYLYYFHSPRRGASSSFDYKPSFYHELQSLKLFYSHQFETPSEYSSGRRYYSRHRFH